MQWGKGSHYTAFDSVVKTTLTNSTREIYRLLNSIWKLRVAFRRWPTARLPSRRRSRPSISLLWTLLETGITWSKKQSATQTVKLLGLTTQLVGRVPPPRIKSWPLQRVAGFNLFEGRELSLPLGRVTRWPAAWHTAFWTGISLDHAVGRTL